MNQSDYLAENSLRSYPFKDGSQLLLSNGLTLPNSVVLDFQFDAVVVSELASPYYIQLDSLTLSGAGVAFNFSGSVGFSLLSSGSGVNTFYNTVGSNNVFITVDVDALYNYINDNSITAGTYTLLAPPIVCASTIRYQPKMVKQLRLVNTNGGNVGDASYDTTFTAGQSLQLDAGANIDITDGPILSVTPGAGSGLFDNCAASPLQLLSINNQTADNNGNLVLSHDSCIKLTPGTHSLTIGNTCLPSCQSPDIGNLAHYVNRILSRGTELADNATQAKHNYDSWVSVYTQSELAKQEIKPPYLLAEATYQSNKAFAYHNITCGIYSPSKIDVPMVFNASYDTGYTLLDDRTYSMMDNVKNNVPFSTFCGASRHLGINSVTFFGFVLKGPAGVLNLTGLPKYDIVFSLAGTDYAAGYVLPLNPISANYTVGYTRLSGASFKTVNFELQFVGNGSGAATLHMESLNTALALVSLFSVQKSQLVVDTSLTNLGTALGFSSVALDLSKSNKYKIALTCQSSYSGTYVMRMTLTLGGNTTTKLVQFSL